MIASTTEFSFLDQSTAPEKQMGNEVLDQYFTPEWAAEELVAEFFGDLSERDLVVEPSCGRGAFLKAIPERVPAIGVEIDGRLAAEARLNTGREILTGDFRTMVLPAQPTAFIGNPPFNSRLIQDFLKRAHGLLPENGRCGFIIPSYVVSYPTTFMALKEDWSMSSHNIPRSLFPGLSVPLLFLLLTKSRVKVLHGFALYEKAYEVSQLNKWAKLLLVNGEPKRVTWRALVEEALKRCGGKASLAELYQQIEGNRPSANKWWKEKVRQVLQLHFSPVAVGVWRLKEL